MDPPGLQHSHESLGSFVVHPDASFSEINWLTKFQLSTYCKSLFTSSQIHRPLLEFERLFLLPEVTHHTLSAILQINFGLHSKYMLTLNFGPGSWGLSFPAEIVRLYFSSLINPPSQTTLKRNYKLRPFWSQIFQIYSDLWWASHPFSLHSSVIHPPGQG